MMLLFSVMKRVKRHDSQLYVYEIKDNCRTK
jgi:hypothetical protein